MSVISHVAAMATRYMVAEDSCTSWFAQTRRFVTLESYKKRSRFGASNLSQEIEPNVS